MNFFYLSFIIFLCICPEVKTQDENKHDVQFTKNNFNSTSGIYLPWIKTCQSSLDQINTDILVKFNYNENIQDSNNIWQPIFQTCVEKNVFICRVTTSNGKKIIGKVYLYLFKLYIIYTSFYFIFKLNYSTKKCIISKKLFVESLIHELHHGGFFMEEHFECYELLTNPKMLNLKYLLYNKHQYWMFKRAVLVEKASSRTNYQTTYIGQLTFKGSCNAVFIKKTDNQDMISVYFGKNKLQQMNIHTVLFVLSIVN